MNRQLVSIIVPIYNQEKYLEKSIQSILRQTHNNIEIILVNDGSNDKSKEIIDFYRNKDSRIKVVEKSNGGLSSAIISGVEVSNSDYTVFIDPDDYVGENLVENFLNNINSSEIVAMGFYLNNKGHYSPYYLKETKIIKAEEARKFIKDNTEENINNLIFVSRWNKLYKTDILKKMLPELRKYQEISFGEDSIFNSLALAYSEKISIVAAPNSYFYNIGNNQSMMKKVSMNNIDKIRLASDKLKEIQEKYNSIDEDQVSALFYFLSNGEISRAAFLNYKEFKKIYGEIINNPLYKSTEYEINKHSGVKKILRRIFKKSSIGYYLYKNKKDKLKKIKLEINFVINEVKKIKKENFSVIYRQYKWDKQRKNAFSDLNTKIELVEKRTNKYFKNYNNIVKGNKEGGIEKNIFLFWWDGFENAPVVVKKCRQSVIKNYPEFNIVEIDKTNYSRYTDIDSNIISGFLNNRISIQTFSDILRFNLLKNNGGIWIDSTIMFFDRVDLTKKLTEKSFDSLEFSSSYSFFEYKGVKCSWSGYFISSVKNGNFVTFIDTVYKEYYREYNEYTTYFFIDMMLMLSKINKLDDDVLSKTLRIEGDMFLLANVLEDKYDSNIFLEISKIPQKLNWGISNGEVKKGSFRFKLLRGELDGKN